MVMLEGQEPVVQWLDQTSQQYLGQWNRLVSTTNWEKGRIITLWRSELMSANAEPNGFSDDAWSRRVGNVTGQHVGRLRRVYERFAASHDSYQGLYWSHFQAALDWHDAEMWLEGAVQNDWSVSTMRTQRFETLNPVDEAPPREDDLVVAEVDEDSGEADAASALRQGDVEQIQPFGKSQDRGAFDGRSPESDAAADSAKAAPWEAAQRAEQPGAEAVRPFARLAELPSDLADAFESYKLALLRHKLDGWQQISRSDAIASLDALKELALAPSEA